MARLARVLALGVPHHVTQRGNGRTFVLNSDAERDVYRTLLQEQCEAYGVGLIGYCLMSNHVHLIGKRTNFPSGVGLGSGLSMASWISQRKRDCNVVFANVDPLLRSGGLSS